MGQPKGGKAIKVGTGSANFLDGWSLYLVALLPFGTEQHCSVPL